MLEGSYNGIFSAYLPAIQSRLNISDKILGLAMFLLYFGQVLATPGAGEVMRRWGSRAATFSGGFFFATSFPLLAATPSVLALCSVLLWYGLAQGFMDCSMNSSGVLTEAVAGYPVLGSYHGSYSIAAAIGGFVGSAMSNAGWKDLNVYSVTAGIGTLFTIIAGSTLYGLDDERAIMEKAARDRERTRQDSSSPAGIGGGDTANEDTQSLVSVPHSIRTGTDRSNIDDSFNGYDQSYDSVFVASAVEESPINVIKAEETKRVGRFWWLSTLFMLPRTRPMVYLSMMGFLAAFSETALTTFLIIFSKRYFSGAPSNLVSVGFVCFEVCMGCGRFVTDKLRAWLGSRRLAKIGGCLASTGVFMLSMSPSLTPASGSTASSLDIIVASVAMCFTGLGLSTLIPTTFAVAGYIGHSGTSIATVGCWMYAGGIASSPIIGAISSGANSLRVAMAFLACMAACVIPLGFVIPEDRYTAKATNGIAGGLSSLSEDDDISAPLIV